MNLITDCQLHGTKKLYRILSGNKQTKKPLYILKLKLYLKIKTCLEGKEQAQMNSNNI